MEKGYRKLHKIELADDSFKEKGLRIRVVKLWYNKEEYTCLTIPQLKEILELWIIGEEERYPLEKGFKGRWLLFDVIKKIFNNTTNKEVKTMSNEQKEITQDWRNEVSTPKTTLKIEDGQTVEVTFKDEGIKKHSEDFGTSVVFEMLHGEEVMNWYVSGNNFNVLGQIKELGTIKDTKIKITRTGSRRSDTRYAIIKVE